MEHAIIDRFEGAYAVVLIGDDHRPLDVPRQHLPTGVREGHYLLVEVVDNQVLAAEIDHAATEAARQRVAAKLERLRRGDHLKDK